MLLDDSDQAKARLEKILFYAVNNGLARRSWARNEEATFAIKREMKRTPNLQVALPSIEEDDIISNLSDQEKKLDELD